MCDSALRAISNRNTGYW